MFTGKSKSALEAVRSEISGEKKYAVDFGASGFPHLLTLASLSFLVLGVFI